MSAILALTLVQCDSGSEGGDDDAGGESGAGNAGGGGAGTAGGKSGGGGSAGGAGASSAGAASAGAAGTSGGSAGLGGTQSAAGRSGAGSGGTGSGSCENPMPVTTRGPAPAAIDEAEFSAQWPALVCAAMEPGCDSSGVAYDEAACREYAAGVLDDTLTYDALAATYCLDALRESTYASEGGLAYRGWPGPCYTVYRGDVPLGEACDRDADCGPDPRGSVWCDFDTELCTVLIRGKLGEPCHIGCELETDDGSCYPLNEPEEPGVEVTCHNEDGLLCGFDGVCEPSIPTGCGCVLGASEYCNAEADCTSDLNAVCIPRGGAGSPCTVNANCDASTYCPAEDPAVCTPRRQAGEPCDDHDQCVGSYCQGGACVPNSGVLRSEFDDAYCDGTGT